MIERGRGHIVVYKCKKCEKVCPQHLPITQYLEEYIVPELERYDPRDDIEKIKKLICNSTGILL